MYVTWDFTQHTVVCCLILCSGSVIQFGGTVPNPDKIPRRGNEEVNIDMNYQLYEGQGRKFAPVYQTIFETYIDIAKEGAEEYILSNKIKDKNGNEQNKVQKYTYQTDDGVVHTKPATSMRNGLITNKEKHWVSIGFVEHQLAFMYKYQKQGIDAIPAIQTFLVDNEVAKDLLDYKKFLTTEKYSTINNLDINVDLDKSPNQLGLGDVSTDRLNAAILPNSLETYIVDFDAGANYAEHLGRVRPVADLAGQAFGIDVPDIANSYPIDTKREIYKHLGQYIVDEMYQAEQPKRKNKPNLIMQ